MVNSMFHGTAYAVPDTTNLAGGQAFTLNPKAAMAQFAVTGCFNNSFYADAKAQLDTVKKLVADCDVEFLLKLAVYSRHSAFMKDMPAFILAAVFCRKTDEKYEVEKYKVQFEKAFCRVIDNGKMLRNFVQIVRSGALGRKSFGTFGRRLLRQWLDTRDAAVIFRNATGNKPSMEDVIRMAHPRNRLIYQYLLGKYDWDQTHVLNEEETNGWAEIFKYEKLKKDPSSYVGELPKVDFMYLTGLPLTEKQWQELAVNASWQQTRMNLNMFTEHGSFKNPDTVKAVCEKLKDPVLAKRAKVMPYQMLAALKAYDGIAVIKDALEDATENCLANAPVLPGNTQIFIDTSGSMGTTISGDQRATITCSEAATLFAIALKKANPDASIYLYNTDIGRIDISHRDTYKTSAETIRRHTTGGGTDTPLCFRALARLQIQADNIVILSDNESWSGGATQQAYADYKNKINRKAKVVCIDLGTSATVQLKDKDVLHVAGFNDSVFEGVNRFFNTSETDYIKLITEVQL